jgi:glutamate-5-semialdehyde dehydrogenase
VLKLGNAAILKGGKESINTSSLLVKIISSALSKTAIPSQAISYLTSREQVSGLLSLTDQIDLVIPRGSNALVSSIQASTRIPVMGHADGRCSIYVHADADLKLARDVVLDAKIDYPAACNAVETLLVHESIVKNGAVRTIVEGLVEKGVQLRCEEDIRTALGDTKGVIEATEEDVATEFLDLRIYIRTVKSLDEAINHINTYSSHHTDSIITSSAEAAKEFQRRVDSAGVYWNASTR